jgi:hypothetical protein
MTPAARAHYHGRLWPAVCEVKGWRVGDEVRRRDVVLECMAKVRGPAVTTSHPDFGDDETTALFCYLEHLAAPADLRKSARWLDCQKDYVAFNRAKQGDWHERQTYGRRGCKLRRDRFGGASSAQGEPFEEFDPKKARQRHMTMANRHRRKKQKAGAHAWVAMIGGREILGPAPVALAQDSNCPW